MATRASDPHRGFSYKVTIDNTVIGCKTVSGLSRELDVTDYREGGDAKTPRQIPGLTKYDKITIERGKQDDDYFNEWFKEVYDIETDPRNPPDDTFRRTMTITQLTKSGAVAKRWRVFHCWPSRIEHSDFSALDSELLYEKIEITHEGWVELPGFS